MRLTHETTHVGCPDLSRPGYTPDRLEHVLKNDPLVLDTRSLQIGRDNQSASGGRQSGFAKTAADFGALTKNVMRETQNGSASYGPLAACSATARAYRF